MSSHGVHNAGEKKVEGQQHIITQNPLLAGHATRFAGLLGQQQPGLQHGEILKTSLPVSVFFGKPLLI